MTELTEKGLEKVIKFGAAFSEVGSRFPYRNHQDIDTI
jgi:hypothetical protein